MSDFRILLEQNPGQQVYFSGQTVTGSLELDLAETKSYNYIQVLFSGKGLVHWSENHAVRTLSGQNSYRTQNQINSYTAYEPYVEQAAVLWNKEQTPHHKIGPGTFKFPFQFTIPPHCPSSFQGSFGRIEYCILGRIGTGLFQFDQHVRGLIQVCQISDINKPQFLAPQRQTQHKVVGLLCCASGNIQFTVDLPRTGFCINGDRIPLSVMVENGSGRDITMRATLSKNVTYYARGHGRYNGDVITLVSSDIILRHSTHTWSPDNLTIPMVEPTLSSSRIISVDYILDVIAVVPNALNSSITFPIVLGNVPYQGSSETAVASPSISFSPNPDPQLHWPDGNDGQQSMQICK